MYLFAALIIFTGATWFICEEVQSIQQQLVYARQTYWRIIIKDNEHHFYPPETLDRILTSVRINLEYSTYFMLGHCALTLLSALLSLAHFRKETKKQRTLAKNKTTEKKYEDIFGL